MSADPRDAEMRDLEWLAEVLDEPARALAALEPDNEAHEAGVRCEYLALLGMLPLAVDPVAPSPGLEERVLAAARREGRSSSDRPREAPAAVAPVVGLPRYHRWLLPLAATLAIAALGLAGWQSARLGELEATIARQSRELVEARSSAERLAELRLQNADLAGTIALLTSAGVEFCPLRPMETSPMPAAWGALAMSEAGDHWYLRVVGLEPREDGLEYRLWFLRDGAAMAHSRLELRMSDGALELMDGDSPEGFNAVLITLEPSGSEAPSGPQLLFGNERMQIL